MKDTTDAFLLGVRAFRAGKKCIPAFDRNLMNMLPGLQVGQGKPYLLAWQKGWTFANLSNKH